MAPLPTRRQFLQRSVLAAGGALARSSSRPVAGAAGHFRPPLFAFCHDTHDTKERTLAEQAALLKELGFAGAGHLWLDQLAERVATLEAAGLRLFQVYLRATLAPGQAPYEERLKAALPLLKGRDTMLAVLVSGGKPSDAALDSRAVEVAGELADLARSEGLRVALYPHKGDWLERVEDALRVSRKVGRANLGVMFNLCHWLAVGDEARLKPLLEEALPALFAVSVHGADCAVDVQAGKGNWIQPLGSGTFDMRGFLKTLQSLDYRGPVGLQCYGLAGDAREHLTRSMTAWKNLLSQLN